MAGDFEAELRRSLSARASDVSPDPALFARVQSRIRRGRTFRLALAGVAGALAVGGAALAAPGLIDRRVEFEPGPVAGQPASEMASPTVETEQPTQSTDEGPALAAMSAPMVFTDGATVFATVVGGEATESVLESDPRASTCLTGASCPPIVGVAGFTDGAVAVDVCKGLRFTGNEGTYATDGCPTSAVLSPDNRHLAYVAQAGGDGEWLLHTLEWSPEGPGATEASFGLGFGPDETVRIEDWTWTRNDTDGAEGSIYLQVAGPDGVMTFSRDIERQGDGALALPQSQVLDLDPELANYLPLGTVPNYSAVAVSAGSGSDHYVLEVHVEDDAVNAGHITGVGGEYLDLPDDVLNAIDADAIADLWLTSSGDDIVLGDGTGKAWAVVTADTGEPSFVRLDATILHADLVREVQAPDVSSSESPRSVTQVDVFFGMTGAEACVADQPVAREIEGPGVARGALTELLEGPTPQESNLDIASPFSANTAGTLNDITIEDGVARVDFVDFSVQVDTDACTKSAIVDSLDKTLLQFPTVTSTRYSFDGDVTAWEEWLGSDAEHPAPPAAVTETAERIRGAAVAREWDALRRLSKGTSCTLSDQPEPCVPVWKEQEANGGDPLGTLVELLEGPPGQVPGTAIWAWPAEFAAGDSNYDGPRIGIDATGKWRYFVQEGG